jgi:hypothetical protein
MVDAVMRTILSAAAILVLAAPTYAGNIVPGSGAASALSRPVNSTGGLVTSPVGGANLAAGAVAVNLGFTPLNPALFLSEILALGSAAQTSALNNLGAGSGVANAFKQPAGGAGGFALYSQLAGSGGTPPDGTSIANVSSHLSVVFGTTAGTAAQGNDSRITGAVQTGGALGTPSSGTLTNATGLPTTGLTGTLQAGQFPVLTGDVTNSAGSLAVTVANAAITAAKMASGAAIGNIGYTPVKPANNGTDFSSLATTRTNLGGFWKSVIDYGAKCNTSNDDTSSIQSALNAGGWISMPAGCLVTSTLTLTTGGTHLVGSGQSYGSLFTTIADNDTINIGCFDCSISDFRIIADDPITSASWSSGTVTFNLKYTVASLAVGQSISVSGTSPSAYNSEGPYTVASVIGGGTGFTATTPTTAVTSASWSSGSGGVVTFHVASVPSYLTTGQQVIVSGTSSTGGIGYNATYTVTGTTTNSWTAALASDPGTWSSGGTILVNPGTYASGGFAVPVGVAGCMVDMGGAGDMRASRIRTQGGWNSTCMINSNSPETGVAEFTQIDATAPVNDYLFVNGASQLLVDHFNGTAAGASVFTGMEVQDVGQILGDSISLAGTRRNLWFHPNSGGVTGQAIFDVYMTNVELDNAQGSVKHSGAPVSSVACSAGVATYTLSSSPSTLATGVLVEVGNMAVNGFNGLWTVATVPTGSSFTVPMTCPASSDTTGNMRVVEECGLYIDGYGYGNALATRSGIYNVKMTNIRAGYGLGKGICVRGAFVAGVGVTNFSAENQWDMGLDIEGGSSDIRFVNGIVYGNDYPNTAGVPGVQIGGGSNITLDTVTSQKFYPALGIFNVTHGQNPDFKIPSGFTGSLQLVNSSCGAETGANCLTNASTSTNVVVKELHGWNPVGVSAIPATAAVTSGTGWASNVVTFYTSAVPATLVPGASVTVSGATPSGYNGTYTVTSTTATTWKAALLSSPGTWSSGGTATINSPWTYTNGASPSFLHLYGGTCSAITVGGTSWGTTCSDINVPLAPGQAAVVTFSAAPTANVSVQ